MGEESLAVVADRAGGGVDAEMIRRAEAAVAALADNFSTWIAADIATAWSALEEAEASETAARGLETLYTMAHNIKGYSGTFGYGLATDVAASLCLLLKRAEGGEVALEVASSHLKGLDLIVEHDITGAGGEPGRALLAKLEGAVARVLGEA